MKVKEYFKEQNLEENELTDYEFEDIRHFTNLGNEYTVFDDKVIVIESYSSRIVVMKFGTLEYFSQHLVDVIKDIDFQVMLYIKDENDEEYLLEVSVFELSYLRKLNISLLVEKGDPFDNYLIHNPYGVASIVYNPFSDEIIKKTYKLNGKTYDEFAFEIAKAADNSDYNILSMRRIKKWIRTNLVISILLLCFY